MSGSERIFKVEGCRAVQHRAGTCRQTAANGLGSRCPVTEAMLCYFNRVMG
jgi:hypothetical protein